MSLTLGGGEEAKPRHAPPTPNFGFPSDFSHFILRKAILTFKKERKKGPKNRKIFDGNIPSPSGMGGGGIPRVPRGAAPGKGNHIDIPLSTFTHHLVAHPETEL